MMRFLVVVGILLLTSLHLIGQSEKTGEWSEVVNGIKGRLITASDPDLNGTKMAVVYLELRNVSISPFDIYFDVEKAIQSKVLDGENKQFAEYAAPASIMNGTPAWLVLPADGTLRFRVSVSGYGVPKNAGTNVQMMSGNWIIPQNDEREFFIDARLFSDPPRSHLKHEWIGEIILPKVRIPR